MAVIMICNVCNAPRGKIVTIKDDSHVFTKNESKQEWIDSGESAETWSDLTYLFYVTDKTKSQLDYLTDATIDFTQEIPIPVGDLYRFDLPTSGTFFDTIDLNGEYHDTWSVYEPYLLTFDHITE